MNKVILMGRLTRDPEVRKVERAIAAAQEQMTIARYTLAVDRRKSSKDDNQPTADFVSCVAFSRAGEFAEKYFRKGTKIAVTGHIQTGSYTNKDGQKVYTTEVVVEEQEFAESKASGSSASTSPANTVPSSDNVEGFMNIPDGIDEELPFN